MITLLIDIISLVLALMIDDLLTLFSVSGSITCSFLVFIIPGYLFLNNFKFIKFDNTDCTTNSNDSNPNQSPADYSNVANVGGVVAGSTTNHTKSWSLLPNHTPTQISSNKNSPYLTSKQHSINSQGIGYYFSFFFVCFCFCFVFVSLEMKCDL